MLASEYGWTKTYILESIYPDDLIILSEEITKRLVDKLLTDLRIATNPHLEPAKAEEFFTDLLRKRRAIWGVAENTAPLDREMLDRIKEQFKNGSSAIKAK